MSDSYLSKTGLSYFWSKLKLAFAALVHVHASSDITSMTGYSKPSSTSAIAASDTLNQAMGKLEKAIDDADISNVVHKTGDEVVAGTKTFVPTNYTDADGYKVSELIVKDNTIDRDVPLNDARHYTQIVFNDANDVRLMSIIRRHTSATVGGFCKLSCFYTFNGVSDRSDLEIGCDGATGDKYCQAPSTSSLRTEGTDVVTRDWIPKDSRIFQKADAEAMGFFGSADPPSLSGTTLDMNDIVTPGVYYINTSWTTAHLPYDTVSNGIVVVYTRGTNYLVKQVLYRQGTLGSNDWQTFVRMGTYQSESSSYAWGEWHRYATWLESEFHLRGSTPTCRLRSTKLTSIGTAPATNAYCTFAADLSDGSATVGAFQIIAWTDGNVSARIVANQNKSGGASVYADLDARADGNHEFILPATCRPYTTNKWTLGNGTYRWKQLYANTATINTSDERFKASIASVPDEVLDAWGDVGWLQFRFKDAVAEKGDGARLHGGLIAQRIDAAFKARGLDASAYGLFCYDEWDAVDRDESVEVKPAVLDDAGNVVEPAVVEERHEHVDAGDMYSLRYEEAFSMEAAYMRRENARLKKRVADLEERLAALELKVS